MLPPPTLGSGGPASSPPQAPYFSAPPPLNQSQPPPTHGFPSPSRATSPTGAPGGPGTPTRPQMGAYSPQLQPPPSGPYGHCFSPPPISNGSGAYWGPSATPPGRTIPAQGPPGSPMDNGSVLFSPPRPLSPTSMRSMSPLSGAEERSLATNEVTSPMSKILTETERASIQRGVGMVDFAVRKRKVREQLSAMRACQIDAVAKPSKEEVLKKKAEREQKKREILARMDAADSVLNSEVSTLPSGMTNRLLSPTKPPSSALSPSFTNTFDAPFTPEGSKDGPGSEKDGGSPTSLSSLLKSPSSKTPKKPPSKLSEIWVPRSPPPTKAPLFSPPAMVRFPSPGAGVPQIPPPVAVPDLTNPDNIDRLMCALSACPPAASFASPPRATSPHPPLPLHQGHPPLPMPPGHPGM